MRDLTALRAKKERLVIGLMSGTSADGIDAALTKISGCGTDTKAELLSFLFTPFPPAVREKILAVAGGEPVTAAGFCCLKTLLGQLYAEACLALCRRAGVAPEQIDLVGNHGQTLWHIPQETEYLGRTLTGTLQVGEDAVIAQALGCPVVGDFRVRDMAAGGQGAPLVPYTEFLLYRREDRTVALQNIGGIGNVTILPAGCALEDVTAFDTGPGNMVLDALVRRLTDGRQNYDEGGRLAAEGRVSQPLLAWMLADPYLDRRPPKTTGREDYGGDYVARLLERAEELGVGLQDALATAGGGRRRELEPHPAGPPAGLPAGLPGGDPGGPGNEQRRQGGGGLRHPGQRGAVRQEQQRPRRHRGTLPGGDGEAVILMKGVRP